MNFWLKIILVVAGIWIIVGGAIYWARHLTPTASSTAAYIRSANITAKSGTARAKAIQRVEKMVQGLTAEERQQWQRDETTREFWAALTPEEQRALFEALLPSGFKQMMEAFNKMEPARRKKIIEQSLAEMKKHEGEQPPPGVDEQLQQRIINEGMKSFYSDASADTKLDMAPLIEQMQRNMQGVGGR
jgi:hypothetical protein